MPFKRGDAVELTRAIRCESGKIIPIGENGTVTRSQNKEGVSMVLFKRFNVYLYATPSSIRRIVALPLESTAALRD